MNKVVYLRHFGVPCALPSKQVLACRRRLQEAPPVSLWGTLGNSPESEFCTLLVRTPVGARTLSCAHPTFGDFRANAASPLSELLRGSLGLPHVIGAVHRDNALVWLVDLRWWKAADAEV